MEYLKKGDSFKLKGRVYEVIGVKSEFGSLTRYLVTSTEGYIENFGHTYLISAEAVKIENIDSNIQKDFKMEYLKKGDSFKLMTRVFEVIEVKSVSGYLTKYLVTSKLGHIATLSHVSLEKHGAVKIENVDSNIQKDFRKSAEKPSPLDTQIGGGHYKEGGIQPIQYIHANKLGFIEGNIVKYITRHRSKNGIEDLKKIKHYVDLLIELEYTKKL